MIIKSQFLNSRYDAGRKVCIWNAVAYWIVPYTRTYTAHCLGEQLSQPFALRLPRKTNVVVQETAVLGPNPFYSNCLQKLKQQLHRVTDSARTRAALLEVVCCVTVFVLCILLFIVLVLTVSACYVRAATLTEVLPCFLLSCKPNARV
jgi:hypothetical protein